MRTRITLACTECKQRNYNMTKDKKLIRTEWKPKSTADSVRHNTVTQRDEVRVTVGSARSGNLPERFGGQKMGDTENTKKSS